MKKLKTIGIIGHFACGLNMTDGQTVKTVTVTNALEERFGADEVIKADTHGGVKNLLKMPFTVIKMMRKATNIIILPAQRGLRVIVPLLVFFNNFYHRKLHYCVIGGWLPGLIKNKKRLINYLQKFSGIYAETTAVKKGMEQLGFTNVSVVPNCKKLEIAPKKQLEGSSGEPLKLCTFSRVMKEKGIDDAVEAVKALNNKNKRNIFSLDIYGSVDPNQTEWFNNLKLGFPDYIKYRGVVPFDKSVETLREYYALVFPTRFYTEGIPGTVIDAYAAGVPVVSARWESCGDIVEDMQTGLIYEFGSEPDLEKALEKLISLNGEMDKLKTCCLKKAVEYKPENALKELFARIEN